MKEGWKLKSLKELFDVKSSKRVHKADWKKEGVPFYRAREVVKLAQNGTVDNDLFISEELFQEFTKEKGAPKVGDIIISAVGTLGQCYLVKKNDRFYFKDASVLWFENISDVNARYIEYAFKSDLIMKQVMHKSMGATVGTLTIERAKIIKIPVPALSEQKQIVEILDDAFTAIDNAKANIENNIQNAKHLFKSKLKETFSQKGEGWEEKKLIEVCEVKDGTHDSPKYVDEEKGIPFITQKNILKTGLSFENTKFISQTDHEDFYRRSNVAQNDILIAMIGANRGMACLVDTKRTFSIKNVGLIKASESFNPKFLLFYLKSPIATKYVADNSSGSAQGFIGLGKLRTFPVPSPHLTIQDAIVKQLELLDNEVRVLSKHYNYKIMCLDDLKKSILQKAFVGELTTKPVEV